MLVLHFSVFVKGKVIVNLIAFIVKLLLCLCWMYELGGVEKMKLLNSWDNSYSCVFGTI